MSRLAVLGGAAALVAISGSNFSIPANNLAHANALAVIDPDLEACATAGEVVTYCYDFLPADAVATDSASCYCCDQATFLAPVYSSCEDYIVASAPQYTDDYSVVSIVQSECLAASQEGFRCGGGGAVGTATGFGGVTQTDSNTQPTGGGGVFGSASASVVETFGGGGGGSGNTQEPPACTSFAAAYSSCANAVRGFTTMDDLQAASCLCYRNGKFTTSLDDYISTCAQWVKTARPDEYESYVAIETYCEEFSSSTGPTGGSAASFGAASNTNGAVTSNSGGATSRSSTPTKTQKTVTVTPSPTGGGSSRNAGSVARPAQAGGGLAAWLAVVLPFVL